METVSGDAPADHGTRQLARRGSASLFGSAVTAVAQLVLTVAVARGLTQQDAGLFFSATSLFLILSTVARLGTPTGLVWALSGQQARGEVDLARPTLRAAMLPVLAAGVLVGAALLVWAGPVSRLLLADNAAAQDLHRLETIVRSMAVLVPVAAVYDAVCAATRGLGSMRPTVLVERIARPIGQCVAVVAVAWFASSVAVSLAWLLPYAVALAISLRMLRRILRRVPAGPAPSAAPVPRDRTASWFWRFTGPRALANVAQAVQQRLDIVLVGALRGPRDAAVYAAATRFLVVGQAAGLAISLAVQPNLGAELGVGDRRAAGRVYLTATAWLMVVTWPIYLFAFVCPELILSVFGSGYEAGTGVIRILAATMLVATGCGMVDMVLTMAGRTWWSLANVVVAISAFLALNLLLIPTMGIAGAALAWAGAILINNLLPLAQVGLSLRLHPFGRPTAIAAGWAFLACGLLPGAVLLSGTAALWVDALVLTGAGLLYAAGLYRLRIPLQLNHLPIPGRRRRRHRPAAAV